MTRGEQLKLCKICVNQKFDSKQGIICRLTNRPANFVDKCSDFTEDTPLKGKLEADSIKNNLAIKTASKGKRLANFALDWIFILIFNGAFGIMIGIILAVYSQSALAFVVSGNKLIEYLLGFIATMIYYCILESVTGRTIGKFITKTKVVDQNGERPNLGTIFLRSLCRFIPFDVFSFLGSSDSGWHDRISKTIVVEI